MFQSRRIDAEKRGIPFEITDDWARARWTGRCEITTLDFVRGGKGHGPHPFSPSLDRIDPKLGYVPGNARFILWGCNALKGVGTDNDMLRIAFAILFNNGFKIERR